MTEERYFYAIGKRKCAVAKVRLFPGSGTLIVNGKPLEEVLPLRTLQETVQEPFRVAQLTSNYNASIRVSGGGIAGQAQAIRHGIARALVVANEELRPVMRKAGLLTRDARVKERKKYGQKGARARFQFSKR